VKKIVWFIKQSLMLDYKFMETSKFNIVDKSKFLLIKYFLILKHLFKNFELGKDFCFFNGKKIFYDSKFGLAGYQRILCTHQNLIKLAQINNVKVVIDIGANVGFFSKLCRFLFPESKIFSFEPIPQTYTCLYKNFKSDKNTYVYNLGISDFNGKSKMNFNSQNSAVSQITINGNIKVYVNKLDDFVKNNNIEYIDILKIDTESFESHVLRGAHRALSKTKYIFMEITMEANNYNYTISSLLKLLSSSKFDFQLIAFRNYADKSEGEMPIMDALFKNIRIK